MFRRFWAVAVLLVLAVGLLLPPAAQAKAPSVLVRVTDEHGMPVVGAHVSLWNHSSSPSELAGEASTDSNGEARFELPKMKGPKEILSQHLAASVYAQGFDHFVTDWSIGRKKAIEQDKDEVLFAEVPSEDSVVSVNLQRATVLDGALLSSASPLRTSIGETRERLVWSSNYPGQLTIVGTLHQVGDMQTGFKYGSTLANKQGVGVKYEDESVFSVHSSIDVSEYVGYELSWDLNPTGNDYAYKYRVCKTYFDYRAEEYYVEEFKDRGDGVLDWVKVDSYIKTYCVGVSDNPTSAGSGILATQAPVGLVWNRDYAPTSGSLWTTTTHETIDMGVTFYISGIPVTLGVTHNSSTTDQWRFYNTSTTKFYQGAPAPNGIWRVRLKP